MSEHERNGEHPEQAEQPEQPATDDAGREEAGDEAGGEHRAGAEAGAEAPPPAQRELPLWQQNLMKRVATGVPALIVVLALIALAPKVLLALLVAAAGVYATYEYLRLLESGNAVRLPLVPALAAAGLVGLGGVIGSGAALGGGLFLGVLVLVWALWFQPGAPEEQPLRDAGLALVGLVLVPWLLGHASLVLWSPGGRGLAALMVLAVTFNDTFAYLVGTFLGSRPLLPRVSPHKTVEGALGGLAGGVLAGLFSSLWLLGGPDGYSMAALVLLGVVLGAVGQAGDLLESKIKRLNGADESGTFLPGHGGMLDRVDAYLLAAPVLYYLVLVL